MSMKVKSSTAKAVSAFLGFLGTVNSITIGLYLILTMLDLSSIQDETVQIWIASLSTTVAVAITAYGSYAILKISTQKGGKINIAGGIIIITMYSYFSEFSQPKLLEWLNPYGIALAIPSILSGAIGLITPLKNDGKSKTHSH